MRYRIIVVVLIILLFTFRFLFYLSSLKQIPNGNLRISGTIRSEPSVFDKSQGITLENYKIYLPLHPTISLGDRVVVEGEAEEGVIKKGKIISHEESGNILHTFRKRLLDFYLSELPGDMAALVSGCVIGSKQLLTSDFWNKLTDTGTAHVVVASGMNVTIISKFILDLLVLILPRRKAIPFTFLAVWFYAALAGFGAPIIRATIMGSLTFTAQEVGRIGNAIRAFFITALGMLFFKPEWLWDISFLLTCTATLSILLLQKPIDEKLHLVPQMVRNDFTTSLAASVGVSPILWIAINLGLLPIMPPFDPFPFVLMTTAVSLEAIILSCIVLMSQSRSGIISALREEMQLQVNFYTEREITKILKMMAVLMKNHKIKIEDDPELVEMLKDLDHSFIEKKLTEQLTPKEINPFEMVTKPVEELGKAVSETLPFKK